jgi:methylamine--corrinoid protein Co-methyltransferase
MSHSSFLFEAIDMAEKGRIISEQEFDRNLYSQIKRILKEYPSIKYNPEEICPSDDGMADALFEASLKLASEVGMLVLSSERVVKYSEEEIMRYISLLSGKIPLGKGNEQIQMSRRQVEDKAMPLVIGGGAGSPIGEGDDYVKFIQSYAREPVIDLINNGSPATIEGREPKAGSPLELLGAINEVAWIREGARRAGRSGMPMMVGPGMAVTAITVAGAINEDIGIRTGDIVLVAVLNELKTDYDRLNRALILTQNAISAVSLIDPVLGGYAGPPEGAALVGAASCLLSSLIYNAECAIFHPIHAHFKNGATTPPATLWIENIVTQSLARNCPFQICNNLFTVGRAGSHMVLYEVAANSIGSTVSGGHIGPGVGGVIGGPDQDCITGLEGRFMGEVARASTGLTRGEANRIILELVKKYQKDLQSPPQPKKFRECYEWDRVLPKPEWFEMYLQAKVELAHIGLEI